MAVTTIKSTYSLDVATVATLEEIARRWGVPKSEALRRAIRAAAQNDPEITSDPLQAFSALQRSLGLSKSKANAWNRRIRAERRAADSGTKSGNG
ncbi:MAG: ribbon-helix-helix protein, CopG family [Acidimicrobiia bacterium]|nr:ribbon-helix-helix protein, CopG family [Acidimicrobiia bacterium]